ncbi:MAG: radical SAM protein [Bacilli bacterium]|nr:radical SAM protein [Bacilli bacterium]
MNIRRNKILLYKIGRYQMDFEYLFPKANICGYIVDVKDSDQYNGKKLYQIDEITKSKFKHYKIIICDRKDESISNKLKSSGFLEKKNYYWLEDIGYLLDDSIDYFTTKFLRIFIAKVSKYFFDHDTTKNSVYFKEMIYTDSVDNVRCEFPFKYVQLQKRGYNYCCCDGWTKRDIGNSFFRGNKGVWNSNLAQLHRLSIINKTYIFCLPNQCPFMKAKAKKTSSRFYDLEKRSIPEVVCVAFDSSCNLKCPSCRKDYFNAQGFSFRYLKHLSKKFSKSDLALKSKELIIASQGEVFFSRIYKDMIFKSKITERDSITIHTNATLLTKRTLDKLCSIYKEIKFLISVDAIKKETYEKIRCGGNFDILMKNLAYLSEARKSGKVQEVSLLYVVQKGNYKEMIDFVKYVKKMGFDFVDFSRIENWLTFTDEEFKNVSMYDENGQAKKELKEVLKNPIFKDKVVLKGNVIE